MVIADQTQALFEAFYSQEKSISRKKKHPVHPVEKFPSLALLRNTVMLKYLIIQFLLYYF